MRNLAVVMIVGGVVAVSGCNGVESLRDGTATPAIVNEVVPVATDVMDASETACVNGGVSIVQFLDANKNQKWENSETVISYRHICNGVNGQTGKDGAQGYGAGVLVQAAPAAACPAGGTLVYTFIDKNNDGVQDKDEALTSKAVICNGIAGQDGRDGKDGVNGQSAQIKMSAATAAQCPAGGVVYSIINGDAKSSVNVVCNGVNGANGTNGINAKFIMGAVGEMIPAKAYSACHHDYLFFPSGEKTGGWLTFRHQKNGSADQGIGATGFQVWNVDISEFNLISEVGNVVYCKMHWDALNRQLTYTVVDKTDGMAGRTDTIRF
ncbi:MAG: hypothetical protein AB7P04_02305 [Bacteriovoracia bacterium]